MTSLTLAPSSPASRVHSLARAAPVAAALAAVVFARWAAWRSDALDPIVVGALFGAGLLTIGVAAGWRPSRVGPRQAARFVALGLAGGLVLAATALVGPHPVWSAELAAGFPIGPWAAATILVASAEEIVLRGSLFDRLASTLGIGAVVVATSLAFALIHVPVYGWSAVPLDLGVGLVLGGLRLASGGIVAPAVAHTVADLAVLWL